MERSCLILSRFADPPQVRLQRFCGSLWVDVNHFGFQHPHGATWTTRSTFCSRPQLFLGHPFLILYTEVGWCGLVFPLYSPPYPIFDVKDAVHLERFDTPVTGVFKRNPQALLSIYSKKIEMDESKGIKSQFTNKNIKRYGV